MVPSTPVSLVKFAVRLASVSTGWSSSTPTRDQVPQEMYAKSRPRAGTATTADAVSCEPTAITGSGPPGRPGPSPVSPGSAATSGRRVPMTLPGWRSAGNSPAGRPARPIRSQAQSRARVSYSWVVDALVTSAPISPVSQYASRSGISSRVRAAASCRVRAAAASW